MVGCCRVVGGVFGGVGAQVLEGFLTLGDKLFERRKEQLGGGRTPLGDDAVGRGGRAVYFQGIFQAGAPTIGGVRALGASGCPEVKAPAAARTAVHCLQEETVWRAAMR